MIELTWLDHFDNNDLTSSFSILNRFLWNLRIVSSDNVWGLYGGDSLLFKTDSKEAFEAFLYGLGVTYMSYDVSIIDAIDQAIKNLRIDDW